MFEERWEGKKDIKQRMKSREPYKIESLLVSGNRERIFINTAIGCDAGCKYCYLPDIEIHEVVKKIDKQLILNEINKREVEKKFVKGPKGTIVSFGCFTECWNEDVRNLTIDMLLYFINKGNYIQIATKEYIQKEDIEFLSRNLKYQNQVTINVSLPVFKDAIWIEPYAERVKTRIRNFEYNKKYNIDTILYIKPVLENITIGDLDTYIKLISEYQLKVVVGNFLSVQKDMNTEYQMVGNRKMWLKDTNQQKEIVKQLSKITMVYENSTEVIEEYRRIKTYDK